MEPEIGMGVTIHIGSDRYAGTINRLIGYSRRTVLAIQHDKATITAHHDYYNRQDYTYTRNHAAKEQFWVQDKSGRWCECLHNPKSGQWNIIRDKIGRLELGVRDHYSDPSF